MNENYNDIHGTVQVTIERPEANKIKFVLSKYIWYGISANKKFFVKWLP